MKVSKLFKIILLCLCVSALCIGAAACSGEIEDPDGIKVVFELEGGSFQNCKLPATYFYKVKDGQTETLILDPETIAEEKIEKQGWHIEGWYRTKTVEGETVSYGGRWNFDTDKVGLEGITLYAQWKRNVTYTFSVCYRDDAGQTKVLGSYEALEGTTFDDYLSYADDRKGYTALPGYFKENGEEWLGTDVHPGGDTDVDIKLFVNYVEGEYTLVGTAAQLAKAKGNVYLLNDIDMGGEELGFANFRSRIFEGNGHTVTNFKIKYSQMNADLVEDPEDENNFNCLAISIFGGLNGSTIRNVNFTQVSVELNVTNTRIQSIYLAPIGVSAIKTEIKNVTFEGSYKIVNVGDITPVVKTDGPVYKADSSTKIENSTASLTKVEE